MGAAAAREISVVGLDVPQSLRGPGELGEVRGLRRVCERAHRAMDCVALGEQLRHDVPADHRDDQARCVKAYCQGVSSKRCVQVVVAGFNLDWQSAARGPMCRLPVLGAYGEHHWHWAGPREARPRAA